APAAGRLAARVKAAYDRVATLAADYENVQHRGRKRFTARGHVSFGRPRKVRFEFTDSTDPLVAGSTFVWLGGPTLTGRKAVGPLVYKRAVPLAERPNLRGYTYDQMDFHAIVTAFLAGAPEARWLGTSPVGGRPLELVEYPSALRGVRIERVGIDPALDLPAYRELRETADGPAVYEAHFRNVRVNGPLPADTFDP
ncbi:MAG: hypothetical protein FJZ01_21455, partial [Candidatus Sericytochromatia bacterium]|nr:hypothetical protein [Candidatus Tanganyikabacteria bacterium]